MEFGNLPERELISAIAKRAGVTNLLAKQVYYKLSEIIEEKLKEGKSIRLPYIGKFYFYDQIERVSNLTHQVIPPHKKVKFRFRPDLDRYIRVMSREH